MAIVTNTFTTYSAAGNREDLSDMIYNISPIETPFQAMVPKVTASGVYHEWQTDSLAAAATNAKIEGDTYSFNAVTPTTRIGNTCQIMSKNAIVTRTQEAVNKARNGTQSEMALQLLKAGNELRRDMELNMLTNAARVTGNSTTARVMRPAEAWYSTNVSRGSGGANGTASTAATDGTQRALTEGLFKGVLQTIADSGGTPTLAMVGSFNKQAISSFSGLVTRTNEVGANGDKKLVASIDFYESDFGVVKIVYNRFIRSRTCHIMQPDMWAVATLRPIAEYDGNQASDAESKQLITELTLECRNEASSGVIADLLTA